MTENYKDRPEGKKGRKNISAKMNKRRRMEIFLKCLFAIIALAVVGTAGYFIYQNVSRDKVLDELDIFYAGIYFEDISLEGMTMETAKEAVLNRIEEYNWDITVLYQEESIEVENLLIQGKIDAVIDEAFWLGKKGTDKERLAEIENLRENPVTYTLDMLYTGEDITEAVRDIAEVYDTRPVDAALAGFDENTGELQFNEGTIGSRLDQTDLEEQLTKAVSGRNFSAVLTAVYEKIDPEMGIEEAKETYQLLASFETTTSGTDTNRDTNIGLAAKELSGTLVEPDGTFSMMDIVGDTTEEKGYLPAGAYMDGELVQELGGGICQVSSTLYNAVIRTGQQIVERRNHSKTVGYVPLGEDAMVSFPSSDFKFQNISHGSVLVVMHFRNKTLTAQIYGIPVLEEGVSISLESNIVETYSAGVEYEEDGSLGYGVEEVVSAGKDGYKVQTYLIKTKAGVEISRDFLHNSTYKVTTAVVKRNSLAIPGDTTEETSADLSSKEESDSQGDNSDNIGQESDEGNDVNNGNSPDDNNAADSVN